jgi:uncharacterized membrane protein YebE (DUF533 family)
MAESPTLTVIRMWAAVAWADGVIAAAEADGFRRLIDASSLSDEERAIARGFLLEKVDLEGSLKNLSNDARGGIYRAACRMALADNDVAESEQVLLDRLRNKLEIPLELAQQIEQQVPGFPKAGKR